MFWDGCCNIFDSSGKGGKTRNMPLMRKTVDHLRGYLNEFHSDQRNNHSTPLFYSQRDGRPSALNPPE
jgi:site-specific recombinase XerC